jgi:hypothetical protein
MSLRLDSRGFVYVGVILPALVSGACTHLRDLDCRIAPCPAGQICKPQPGGEPLGWICVPVPKPSPSPG